MRWLGVARLRQRIISCGRHYLYCPRSQRVEAGPCTHLRLDLCRRRLRGVAVEDEGLHEPALSS